MKKYILMHMVIMHSVHSMCAQAASFSLDAPESTSHNIVYLFAHGLRSTYHQGYKLTEGHNKDHWIMSKPLATFNFPDALHEKHSCDKKEVNLGQELDIECLESAYQQVLDATSPDHGVVLVGISRGSATILNYAALRKPEQVKAIIVECAFDTLESVVRHLLRRFYVHWVPFSKKAGIKIASKQFPRLNCNGVFPSKVVQEIPDRIPVLLVHSAHDNVVPINSSRRLYCQLRNAQHEHVYLLELASGAHGKALFGKDADSYQYAVHAFYRRYNLPHNEVWAQHGESLLNCCQPLVNVVEQRIKKHRYSAKRSQLFMYEDDYDDNEELQEAEEATC